jgi:uncharacterized membrane-anchored protein
MGNKKEHDWLLYVLIIGFLISVSLFIIASRVALPLLDVSMIWSGGSFQITFTGIAEIIVAIGFAIGIIWRLIKKVKK